MGAMSTRGFGVGVGGVSLCSQSGFLASALARWINLYADYPTLGLVLNSSSALPDS